MVRWGESGRVDAALSTAMMVPQAVSIALGAVLIAVLNYRLLLIIMAVVFVLSAAVMSGRDDWEAEPEQDQAMPVTVGLADAERTTAEAD